MQVRFEDRNEVDKQTFCAYDFDSMCFSRNSSEGEDTET